MKSLIQHIAQITPRVHDRPMIVGLAGSVAAGKSTLAAQLAEGWRAEGNDVELVSTDGFLLPNAVLAARGLLMRKGFPESYDAPALGAFLEGIRRGQAVGIPTYSHQTYDILNAPPRVVEPARIVVVEGINAIQPAFTEGKLDVALYLDADEADLFRWYYARGMKLREAARTDHQSYFTRYLSLSQSEWDKQLRAFWTDINLPNLHQHILPSRKHANLVFRKDAQHQIEVANLPETRTTPRVSAHVRS